MKNCFICNQTLTDSNASDEHIILNALGGHIHSKQLLCKRCNEKLGQNADAELARELEFYASYLDIPRQRGENRRIETDKDTEYHLLPGGKPELKRPQFSSKEVDGKVQVEMVSRNEAEARQMLKGLKKKYPGLDIEQALAQAVRRKEYLSEKVTVSMGFEGKKIFPSIVKTAVEFYVWKDGDREQIEHLIPYITGEKEMDVCWYFYPAESVTEENDEDILHRLYVLGDAQEGILYAYVSLFGVLQCLVLLNDDYTGEDFVADYCYEVNKAEERQYAFRGEYNRQEILQLIGQRDTKWAQGLMVGHQRFMEKATSILHNRVLERILQDAMKNSFEKYPEGIPMTQEMFHDFRRELEKELYPWLASRMKE